MERFFVLPCAALTFSTSSSVGWTSSAPVVVSITSSGAAKAHAVGSAVISARDCPATQTGVAVALLESVSLEAKQIRGARCSLPSDCTRSRAL